VKSIEREVTLSDGLVAILKEQKLAVGTSEWVFPVLTNRMRTKGDKYWEFPDATWSRALDKANELAQKADPTTRKIVGGPHRCRHTFASHFLQEKPDLFALGRVLGHTHTRVTELYSHLLADHLAGTRNGVTFEPAVVEIDPPETTPTTTPAEPLSPAGERNLVGAIGIEPTTPTVSR